MSTVETDTRSVLNRRRLLVGGLTLAVAVLGGRPARGASKPTISVHKSPT
ncbi:MAG TPA: hypothetical protein VF653_01030 [Methylomirabilota bacterium]